MQVGHLPTVEDNSLGSGGSNSRSTHSGDVLDTLIRRESETPRGLKRSPYLSVMAGSTKESEDLVAMLSRPAPPKGGEGGPAASAGQNAGGGGSASVGKSTFFNLKRPSSKSDDGNQNGAQMAYGANAQASKSWTNRAPSLKSSLRKSSTSMAKTAVDGGEAGELRKNTSVTFSTTTKRGVQTTIPENTCEGNAQFFPSVPPPQQYQTMLSSSPRSDYTAAMMMKKSQSIASPQFMLTHMQGRQSSDISDVTEKTSNASFADQSSQGGNVASFPIYLGNLPEGQETKEEDAPSSSVSSPAPSITHRSKSMSTLKQSPKYACGNNPMAAMKMMRGQDPGQVLMNAAGTPLAHARPSNNGLQNLTFREMLDEGDGREGDLNIKSRNQAWKDFRSFSSKFDESNPMLAASAAEANDDEPSSPTMKVGEMSGSNSTMTSATMPLSGSKRTLTPNSISSNTTGGGSNYAGKNTGVTPNFVLPQGFGRPSGISGTHRATVSVNDLAMLRRAASRIRMNNPSGENGKAGGFNAVGSQQRPGEMLGGSLLSRMSTISSEGGSEVNSRERDGDRSAALSPLAQMMAKNPSGNPSSSGLSAANLQKLNLAMNNTSESLSQQRMGDISDNNPLSRFANLGKGSGMGRRVQTVGAGLAYGTANMTTSNRLSKFDLGDFRNTSRLSEISSGGGSSAGGRNEEWNLS